MVASVNPSAEVQFRIDNDAPVRCRKAQEPFLLFRLILDMIRILAGIIEVKKEKRFDLFEYR